MFIPNGRLSAVEFEGENVQIQTEFAVYPRPRVTTSVVLAGQVIHKEEKLWEAETESPEGQKELESCLQRQHFAVHNRVEQQEIDLRSALPHAARSNVQMPGVDGFALAQRIQSDPELSDTSVILLTLAGQRGDASRA